MTKKSSKHGSLHKQVLKAIPDGITVQDRDFNIIFQNNAMKEAFGDQIGQKCYVAYEKRKHICEGCGLVKAYETGNPVLVHRTGVLKDGSVEHWENSCFPLFDHDDNIVAGVEVCRNVTDRVSLTQDVRDRTIELGKLNDQLNQQKNELEQKTWELKTAYEKLQNTHTRMLQQEKMASIGQLAAGIAHEINTPIQFVGDNVSFLHESFNELLNCINKYQEMTALADKNNEELLALHKQVGTLFQDADFDYLRNEVPLAFNQTADGIRRVSEIVLAMRKFAHSGATSHGPVQVDDLIHSTVEISRNAWKQVAELTTELAVPPLVVKGLHGELGQVLLNLITNAVDAIIDPRCPKNTPGNIHIQTKSNDDWGEIVVKDNGCGMEEVLLDKIFEPFFTTKDVGKGSGQGLSMAYNIVTDSHGGELTVASKPGDGSIFTVRIPLYKENEASIPPIE